jgi:hypothetical protein
MNRVWAVVIAIVMVVAAIAIRARIDDARDADGSARLVCADELAAACLALDEATGGLEITIEPAGVTFARLTAVPDADLDDAGLDGWLVPDPWPAMVDSTRARSQLRPVFDTETTPLGRSPLVIAARDDRARVLRNGRCAGTIAWPCLGDVAGDSWDDIGGDSAWGTVKIGHADPITSATGLLVLAQAASEFLGGTGYSRDDLAGDAFLTWLTRLEASAPSATVSPVEQMLQQFPTAVYDAVGDTEADAGPQLAGAARDRRDAFTLLYPDPVASADVVLALTATDERDDDIKDLAAGGQARTALARTGWRVDGQPDAPGVRARRNLPATTNLPTDPGVYIALQESYRQVTG